MKKYRIGISACLLGLRYRWDGTHCLLPALLEKLADKADFIPVCPEVESGLAIPRPPMRIEISPHGTRLRVIETREDVTEQVLEWASVKLEQLSDRNLDAFLFRSKSPCCGLSSTKLFHSSGRIVSESETGIFAAVFRRRFPRMIVGEETDFEEFLRNLHL